METQTKTSNAENAKIALEGPDSRVFSNSERTAESDLRLKVIDETIRSYQEQFPFIEGATVFGSTVHGGANTESDIDAFIYVDPTKLPEEFSTPEIAGTPSMTDRDARAMGRAIQVDLMGGIGQEVRRGGVHEKNDVRVFAIDEKSIKELLQAYSESESSYYQELEAHRKHEDEIYNQLYDIEGADEWSYEAKRQFVDERLGKDPEFPDSLSWAISGLFHPAVGSPGRIQELRQAVIRELESMPNGQEIWERIISSVEMFEGDLHYKDGQERLLPEDLADAAEQYAA